MALLLVLLVSVFAGPGSAAAVPSATTAPGGLSVQLSSISPPVAKVGQAVTVSGTVTNTGAAAVVGASVQVLLGRQGQPLRPDVATWANGAPGANGANPSGTGNTSGTGSGVSAVAVVLVGQQALRPMMSKGATTDFSVVLPASAVGIPASFAVLPMAITASAPSVPTQPSGPVGAAATIHTFLPWLNSPKRYEPISVAWVLPVTLDPDPDLFDADRPSRAAAWDRAVGPRSRLTRMLTAFKGDPVTWAVDPAVLGPRVDNGADGQPSGSATDSSGSKQVAVLTDAFGARLRGVTKGHPVWSLPYADPDVSAIATVSPGNNQVQSLVSTPAALSGVLRRGVRNDIAWPADGILTPARESALRTLYADAPLTAAVVAAPPTNALNNTTRPAPQKSASGLPLLAFDPELSAELVAATTAGTGGTAGNTAAALQVFLADSMALLSELPGRARTVVIAAPRGYAPDTRASSRYWDAIRSASWLSPVSTTDVMHQALDIEPNTTALGGAVIGATPPGGVLTPAPSPLTRARLSAAMARRTAVDGVSSVMADPLGFRSTWLDAQDQLLSTRWRGHGAQYDQLQRRVRAATDRVRSGVQVRTSSVNFFADKGLLQLTVVNDLDVPVHDVRLRLTPASPKLQILSQPAPLRIGSRSRSQVRVPVKALAAGLVPVEARLTTANGTRLGPRAQMLVRVQPTGSWLYWALGGITAIVLLTGIARSLRRGRRTGPGSVPGEAAGIPGLPGVPGVPAEPLR